MGGGDAHMGAALFAIDRAMSQAARELSAATWSY
jgi:hypothetical protein